VLSPSLDTLRLFLHVLAASVWVGGQITLGGIVPVLRRHHPETTKTVARAFSRVAWTSFVLVFVTGIWNLIDVDVQDASWSYTSTVFVHVALATAAGIAAVAHTVGKSKLALALGGAFGLLFSLAALFVGFLLRTGS
jgi:putative copper export protein